MADYSQIEREQINKNKQYGEQQAQSMRENANSWINELNSAIDAAARPVIEGMENSRGDVANQYKSAYDANAVQELVNRRQVQETMANMGLTDSGLNRTQQTAIALQRGNADASTRMQEQAALDKITQSINEYLAQIASQKQQNSANILGQTNSSISSLEQSLYQNALNNAAAQYQAQLEAEAARAKAEAEAKAAEAQQEWERIQAVMAHNLEVDKLRAQYGEGGAYYAIDGDGNIVTSAVNPYSSISDVSSDAGASGSSGEVADITQTDPTLQAQYMPQRDWTDDDIRLTNEQMNGVNQAVYNALPAARQKAIDTYIERFYKNYYDNFMKYHVDASDPKAQSPRYMTDGTFKSGILRSLNYMPDQFTEAERNYIADMTVALLNAQKNG